VVASKRGFKAVEFGLLLALSAVYWYANRKSERNNGSGKENVEQQEGVPRHHTKEQASGESESGYQQASSDQSGRSDDSDPLRP
jgi:hypothetical protein